MVIPTKKRGNEGTLENWEHSRVASSRNEDQVQQHLDPLDSIPKQKKSIRIKSLKYQTTKKTNKHNLSIPISSGTSRFSILQTRGILTVQHPWTRRKIFRTTTLKVELLKLWQRRAKAKYLKISQETNGLSIYLSAYLSNLIYSNLICSNLIWSILI